jgi:protein gp37
LGADHRRGDLLAQLPEWIDANGDCPTCDDLTDIHWVIVGGESGPRARPMKIEWIREIFRACRKYAVPFFFKQWGGVRKDLTGRLLNGRTYDEMPDKAAA